MKHIPVFQMANRAIKDQANSKRIKRMRERRIQAGLCVRCGKIAVRGQTLCATHSQQWKDYASKNQDKIKQYKRSIRNIENARKRTPAYKANRNANRRKRKRTDLQFAIKELLRKRIGRALRDRNLPRKNETTAVLLGCTIPDFIRHLESLFLPGMTWENRGEWHIDHKRPCASFDLTKPEEQRACFHYTNLQPLWSQDNLKKHVHYTNTPRMRFLQACARVKMKLDEIQQDERRRQFYRPLRRPFKVVRRQVDPLDALLEYWHDRICVFKSDPIAVSNLPKITLP